MRPVVIDTSLWIEWFRGNLGVLREEAKNRLLFMPSIVAMELLSGVRNKKDSQMVNHLIQTFGRHQRLLVPMQRDFERGGAVLGSLGLPASKKSNDVLISVCARRIGAEVWTCDFSDFEPISKELSLILRKAA